MSALQSYAVISREKAETLAFHNLKRLMNKVRGHVSFWENTDTGILRGHSSYYDQPKEVYEGIVCRELRRHRAYLAMLKDCARRFSHVDAPKLKARR